MNLQHLRLAFCDKINPSCLSPPSSSTSSLAINFKRFRPLAPKLACNDIDETDVITSLGLIMSLDSPKQAKCAEVQNQHASPVAPGGIQHEQIRTLEELYRGGMQTPNAQQIERITAELGKYRRIQGKNVFYWFQNHKARERQRQKCSAALLALDTTPTPHPILSLFSADKLENVSSKRKCRSWEDGWLDSHIEGDGTIELFPLHPERLLKRVVKRRINSLKMFVDLISVQIICEIR